MAKNDLTHTTHRRGFIGSLATGAATLGMASLVNPFQTKAQPNLGGDLSDADEWFKKIKGKHRIVFDVTEPHEIFPFAWPRIFLATNAATGTAEKDCSVVVVLRHTAIPYAMEDRLWAKYNFGQVFKINDPKTNQPSTRNPFWKPNQGDFKVPGLGAVPIGMNELQDSGVLFCACNMAVTVYSAAVADAMKLNAEEVKKDWLSGILPGVQVMPAGI